MGVMRRQTRGRGSPPSGPRGLSTWLSGPLNALVLAYLYVEDPRGDWAYGGRRFLQVNLEMVRASWADPYTVPPNVRYAHLYLEAAREARAKGRGMWR